MISFSLPRMVFISFFPFCCTCSFLLTKKTIFLWRRRQVFFRNLKGRIFISCLPHTKYWNFRWKITYKMSIIKDKNIFDQCRVTQVASSKNLIASGCCGHWQHGDIWSDLQMEYCFFYCPVLDSPLMLVEERVDTFWLGYSINT